MKPQSKIKAILIFEDPLCLDTKTNLVQEAINKLHKTFPDLKNKIYTNKNSKHENIIALENGEGLIYCLLEVAKRECKNDVDSIALCYSWYPILDEEQTNLALHDHNETLAHFTFGENLPLGLIPDFLANDFITTLPPNTPSNLEDFRSFVLKNIEQYDVEIYYQSPDLRQYRLDFSTRTSRSQNLCNIVLKLEPNLTYNNLNAFLQKFPEVLRPFYSYFELEISVDFTDTATRAFYWPKREKNKAIQNQNKIYLNKDLIHKLKKDIQTFDLENFTTISLGGHGEPLDHPDFFEILESFLLLNQVETIFIETFGKNLNQNFFDTLDSIIEKNQVINTQSSKKNKIQFIVRLSTLKKDRYKFFYNNEEWDTIDQNIQLWEKNTNYKIFIECLRIKENEDEIDDFMNRFKDTPLQVILQKYNSYINLLPERRIANFNPLHRDFCWHLVRDLYLNVHGHIPICKQDPYTTLAPYIDYQNSNLVEVLKKTKSYVQASVREEYKKLPMPCEKCDEWYTFNA